jgi:hypothetical protein
MERKSRRRKKEGRREGKGGGKEGRREERRGKEGRREGGKEGRREGGRRGEGRREGKGTYVDIIRYSVKIVCGDHHRGKHHVFLFLESLRPETPAGTRRRSGFRKFRNSVKFKFLFHYPRKFLPGNHIAFVLPCRGRPSLLFLLRGLRRFTAHN